MAEDSKPKRRVRKSETVREKASKSEDKSKPRRIRQVTTTASSGVKSASRVARKEYHPIKLPNNKVGAFLTKSRRFIPRFLSEALAELKQVTWPNRQETFKLTTAVIIFAIVFGGLIAITDFGLEKLFKQLLDL